MRASGCWFLLVTGTLCVCLWKTGSIGRWSSSMRAKALIHFDLSIPSSPSSMPPRRPVFDRINARFGDPSARRRYRGTLSRYMLQLYHRRPDADVVRAIQPMHTSSPLCDGGRVLEFAIPSVSADESLEAAELLGIAGAIVRVRSLQDSSVRNRSEEISRSRKDDAWRAFDVTSAIAGRNGDTVKLYVYGRLTYRPYGDSPILLLNYSKTGRRAQRQRRSARADQVDQEELTERWEENVSRRRRRNACRRRPMYVDFALIAYDEWVVAPPGYEAYQCSGKCFYPLGDHLSPTKHAIVQTLVHGALQASEDLASGNNKLVGRACCVPTRLAPTSLLYLDASGTLTYQYGYEDMVVAECGCR